MRSDKLEDTVWNTIHDVLERPDVVLAELSRVRQGQDTPIDDEIAHVRREIRRCKDQEQRLVKLYQFNEVDDEWIKMQSGPTRLRREQHERELRRLEEQRVRLRQLESSHGQLKAYCERVRDNLDSLDFDDRRAALDALQIRVTVGPDEVRISGILGITDVEPDLATTARTSG